MAKSADKKLSVRIDQWLHAARFFKTRGLSAQAIKGGKVLHNGARVKPSQSVALKDVLEIKRGTLKMEVVVLELSTKRAAASITSSWYQETPESEQARLLLQEQLRLSASSIAQPPRRPDKKSRRQIIRFIRGDS